jgi:hypothetical protein
MIATKTHASLYLKHIEEASFLYEQRLTLLDNPDLFWRDLEEFEDRFEAHIDALAYEELAIRYNEDIPFETEMTVKQQVYALNRLSQWAENKTDTFKVGKWYRQSRVVD